jgi:inner membrane protein YidH
VVSESPEGATRRAADSDSRARTHLANERTFLAWLRTGLSLVAVGLAAARFLPLALVPGFPYVTMFSVLLVVCGTGLVLYGGARYVQAHDDIDHGNYDPQVQPMWIIAVVVAALGVMCIPLIFLLR